MYVTNGIVAFLSFFLMIFHYKILSMLYYDTLAIKVIITNVIIPIISELFLSVLLCCTFLSFFLVHVILCILIASVLYCTQNSHALVIFFCYFKHL